MNERQAIDFATEHGIAVTTTRKTKQAATFKVGRFEVVRRTGQRGWLVVGENRGRMLVGEAIEYCVRRSI
ncbi:hypothetical protein CPT_Maja_074 [Burkholderia phage Maja]|uniref:Uncharacterized protein n=1 Tax=Burkholderia phage Maja TaxID=2767571 RepID=A0A7S6R792_9CAUD|nr:hypothetical protein CPT_Maja_074 [Burkholderia phage Maja]